MNVFVTGATGFVGSELLRQLVAAGHRARCLVRSGSEHKLAALPGVEVHIGDATAPQTLAGALAGCDAVIHLVGIIREFPSRGITFRKLHLGASQTMLEAAQDQGVRRFLHMSANGARADATSPYHRTKWQAEQALQATELDWTIFRPSLIYGPGDAFVSMLADLIRRLPLVPVIGDGRYRMSPVAVQDVAAGFVGALTNPATSRTIYHCCGPEALSYNELLDLIGQALGKSPVLKLHHPLWLMQPAVRLLQSIPAFPITSTQLTMLLEGNVCDPAPWAETFGLTPLPFATGVRQTLSA